jgi:hypothetical protein
VGKRRRIGFAGCPPEEVLAPRRAGELIDLDNLVEGVAHRSDSLLPRTTCRIIRRILDNALALDLDEIVIDEGYGKCDTARGLADVLEELLDIPIIRTQNDNRVGAGTPISDSDLPLVRKIELILDGLARPTVGAHGHAPLPLAFTPVIGYWPGSTSRRMVTPVCRLRTWTPTSRSCAQLVGASTAPVCAASVCVGNCVESTLPASKLCIWSS